MSTALQLDLFDHLDEANILRKIVMESRESNRKSSKKLFAMHSELKSQVMTDILLIRAELESIKSQIPKKTEILDFHLQK